MANRFRQDHPTGIRRKLGKAFVVQAGLISLVAVLGVWATALILEEVLVKKAMEDEASYFWEMRESDPGFNLPDTRNLTGFLSDRSGSGHVPEDFRQFGSGFHELESDSVYSLLYVSELGEQRLYLLFDGENVGRLAIVFGLVPLAGVLIVIYLAAWGAYRSSGRAFSPIIALTEVVQKLDPAEPDIQALRSPEFTGDMDHEVATLATALARFSERINDFVERERNFTRDASHELRSPLTVIKIAADMLLSQQELSPPARASVMKIQRSVKDMSELVEAFLVLARESEHGLSSDLVEVNTLLREEVVRISDAFARDRQVEVRWDERANLCVETAEKALAIVLNNLIRNAFSYCEEGGVDIVIDVDCVSISDSGVGMPESDLREVFKPFYRAGRNRGSGGHGVGLTIVKSLSRRFGWMVDIDSEPGVGTSVTVIFPDAIIRHASGTPSQTFHHEST